MWFWKKKKNSADNTFVPSPCNHKYRDFKWYVEGSMITGTGEYHLKVIEPYVCIHCGNRINKVLDARDGYSTKQNPLSDLLLTLCEKYPQIEPRALIEDEIADMQLVDRGYLEIAQQLNPDKKILN